MKLILDGGTGEVIHNPDELMRQEKLDKSQRLRIFQRKLKNLVSQRCQLADGRKIELSANLDFVDELKSITDLKINSIGLVRTEFIFVDERKGTLGRNPIQDLSKNCKSHE